MKKYISILYIMIFAFGCSDIKTYDIPTDENGNILLTGVSSTTTTGISSLDDGFSVTATFATAKVGDIMHVELLQLQTPPEGGTTKQLLPMAGTQKEVTVGSDMKATVSYSRADAKLNNVGDYVTVVYNGNTDYAKQRVDLVPATSVSKPKVAGKEIDVARTSETAYFNVNVTPKAGAYTGTLVAKRKNGVNQPWVDVAGSPFSGAQPFLVPISGDDFAANKDTMYYSFKASSGNYSDEILSTIIVRDPYFYLKKSITLTLGSSTASGVNLLVNSNVAENNDNAMISISNGSLMLKGGSKWLAAGNKIEFVPSTLSLYSLNNSADAKAAFDAGTPTTTADPIQGEAVYIFKAVNGSNASDVYYGMLKVTNVNPNTSVSFEYRIGDQYAHLSAIK